VQAPRKYELLINLKSAKTLRIEVPRALFARADEVILCSLLSKPQQNLRHFSPEVRQFTEGHSSESENAGIRHWKTITSY
jgi:hypothetical protein